MPTAYLPGFWRDVRAVPAGRGRHDSRAQHDLLRREPIGTALLILVAYLVCGAIAVLVLHRQRAPSGMEAEAEASIAATAVV